MEGRLAWLQHVLGDAELHHGIMVHDVDVAAVIDQDSAELDGNARPDKDRIKDQSITPGLGMIFGWSAMLHVIDCSEQYMYFGTAGMTALTSIWRRVRLFLSFGSVTNTT